MRFCVLASGSHGNATYVAGDNGALLIDCGISARQCFKRMKERDIDPAAIKGIVITHEHRDHVIGLPEVCAALHVPVLTSPHTWEKLKLQAELLALQAGKEITFAGFTLHPFSVCHDACDPLALRLTSREQSLAYCTDVGQLTASLQDNLKDCTALILEFNHQPELLRQGPYPQWLKNRIASSCGHLSNQEALELLQLIYHPQLKTLVAAHVSQTNNSSALIQHLWHEHKQRHALELDFHVAEQDTATPIIYLENYV